MYSGKREKFWTVLFLACLFILLPEETAHGIGIQRPQTASDQEARERLAAGFDEILAFFEAKRFSLLDAWSEMRASEDADFFEKTYPEVSRQIDTWAVTLERRFGVHGVDSAAMDFTYLLERLAPQALDQSGSAVVRDNALASACMICVMDGLRCEVTRFHGFLRTVLEEDPQARRKAEALRWWRMTGGRIEESLLEGVLTGPHATDQTLRAEVARILFSLESDRSLQVQKLLATTRGLENDESGGGSQIACTAIRNFARAEFEEATPELIAALEDPSDEVRACAAESLERLGDKGFAFKSSTGSAR